MAFLKRFNFVARPPSAHELLARQSRKISFARPCISADTKQKKKKTESDRFSDLRQAALAIDKAENSMKLMLEVRNKALDAYKELLRRTR
jgi:flagellar hook-basal body complex protein FliE